MGLIIVYVPLRLCSALSTQSLALPSDWSSTIDGSRHACGQKFWLLLLPPLKSWEPPVNSWLTRRTLYLSVGWIEQEKDLAPPVVTWSGWGTQLRSMEMLSPNGADFGQWERGWSQERKCSVFLTLPPWTVLGGSPFIQSLWRWPVKSEQPDIFGDWCGHLGNAHPCICSLSLIGFPEKQILRQSLVIYIW